MFVMSSHFMEQTRKESPTLINDSGLFVGDWVGGKNDGEWVGWTGGLVGATGNRVGSTGVLVGATGDGVGSIGAMVGFTGAAVGFTGAAVRLFLLDLEPFFLLDLLDLLPPLP